MSLLQIIRSKLFILAGCVFLVFMVVIETKQFKNRSKVDQEIAYLKSQAEQVHDKNRELMDLINYLKTDDYKQKAAREQLNLKKEGEFVYSFAGENQAATIEAKVAKSEQSSVSNPKKWWNYFFQNHE